MVQGALNGHPRFARCLGNDSCLGIRPFSVAVVVELGPSEDFHFAEIRRMAALLAIGPQDGAQSTEPRSRRVHSTPPPARLPAVVGAADIRIGCVAAMHWKVSVPC